MTHMSTVFSSTRQPATGRASGTRLLYARAAVCPGSPLPLTSLRRPSLQRALRSCPDIVYLFTGRKLGEGILSLSAVLALADAAEVLGGRQPAVRYFGRDPLLMASTGIFTSVDGHCVTPRELGSAIVVTDSWSYDGPSAVTHYALDPAAWPSWIDGDGPDAEVHHTLSARYYLAIEQAVGIRLPRETPFLPSFAVDPSGSRLDLIVVSAASAAAKQYGVNRLLEVVERLRGVNSGKVVRWALVTSMSADEVGVGRRIAENDGQVVTSSDLMTLGRLFASADLVLGNDTGLMQVAALCESSSDGAQPGRCSTLTLYSRHSWSKWTTGGKDTWALATRFSDYLHLSDIAPDRAGLDHAPWGSATEVHTIQVQEVVSACLEVLATRHPNSTGSG